MAMQLTLVRHTHLNIAPGICYGQSDVPVADSFEHEATRVKKKLQHLLPKYVISSPLSRCRKLADQCAYTPIIEDPRLMELNFGQWEMMKWDDITGPYADRWMKEYYTIPCPGGESLDDMIDRIQLLLFDLKQSKWDNVLLFTHGGPIRVFLYLLNKLEKKKLFERKVDYGEIISLDYP